MRLLALLVAFVAFQAWWFQHETGTERRLGAVARTIANRDVGVRCPSIWKRLVEISLNQGTVEFDEHGPADHANLAHAVCETFAELPKRGFHGFECLNGDLGACDRWVLDVAEAVHVLAHESWHLAGVSSEPAAECYTLQTVAAAARRLGADDAAAASIVRYSLERNAHGPSSYRIPAECRPGGPLDLHPGTAAWPSS